MHDAGVLVQAEHRDALCGVAPAGEREPDVVPHGTGEVGVIGEGSIVPFCRGKCPAPFLSIGQ